METEEVKIFRRLVLPHATAMERLLRRMLIGDDDVRDALQEALMRLWQHRRRLDAVDNIRAYCLTTARRTALDIMAATEFTDGIDDSCRTICADDTQHERDNLQAVEQLMTHLPAAQRTALRLRSYADMDVGEIAVNMNTSEANVRQMLSRARKKLKQLFNGESV